MDRDASVAWVSVGHIVRPHGVHGEMRLHLDVAWESLVGEVKKVHVTPRGGAGPVTAKSVTVGMRARSVHRGALVKLDGTDTPEAAAAWRGADVAVDACHIPPCEDGEFYWTELLGAAVVDASGTHLGVMRRVLDNAGQALGVIDAGDGIERLLPLVPETLYKFERLARRVEVRVPLGLWDT